MTATGLRAACLAALLVLGGPGAHALGSDYGYDSFKTPDAVTWVQLCGAWGPNHQGTYRVVHAEQYAQSFLYVQWMARDANGSLQAAHTVAIAELDNDHAEIDRGRARLERLGGSDHHAAAEPRARGLACRRPFRAGLRAAGEPLLRARRVARGRPAAARRAPAAWHPGRDRSTRRCARPSI